MLAPIGASIFLNAAANSHAASRPWTSRDSVAVRYFEPKTIAISPDKQRFFFVTYRGDLSCNCNVFELSLFNVKEVENALNSCRQVLKPFRVLTRRTYGD